MALALLIIPGTSWSADCPKIGESFLDISAGNWVSADLSGVAIKTLKRTEAAPDCQSNFLSLSFQYPQGLGAAVDAQIESAVKRNLDDEIAEIKNGGFCDQKICGAASCGEWSSDKTFAVHSSAPGYYSVLFTSFSYTGGAHPNTEYQAMNFRPDGQPLTLTDLFPKPEQSVPLYWAYVYDKWCSEHSYRFPLHFDGMQDCDPTSAATPTSPPTVESLDDLGRLVFSSFGATLVLGPYESGTYVTGTVMLDIPKEELIKIGASKEIWAASETVTEK